MMPHNSRGVRSTVCVSTAVSVAIRNALAREGLRRILADAHFQITVSVDHLSGLNHLGSTDPHIFLIERSLLGDDSANSIGEILRRSAEARIVVLVDSFDFREMLAVYAAGAYAYLLNQIPHQFLLAMIQMVALGEKVAPPELIGFLQECGPKLEQLESSTIGKRGLSEREEAVLHALALGLPNKAISRELGVSEAAVKAAVKSVLRKLDVQNRTQAAVLARQSIRLPDTP